MKIYKLPQLADLNPNGEYLLGQEDLNTGNVYLLYGRLRPKETGRKISAPEGFQEIIYVIKGSVGVKQGKASFTVSAGEAFHSKEPFYLDNLNDYEAVYIAAGGGQPANMGQKKEAEAVREEEVKNSPGLEAETAAEAEEEAFEITKEGEV